MPESMEDRCTKSHEYIFLLSKKPHYYYDHEAVKEPAQDRSVDSWEKRKAAGAGSGTQEIGHNSSLAKGKGFSHTLGNGVSRNKRSVWTVNAKGYKGAHFAVYPEELVTPCVLAGCPAGGTVFDPFTGSGTTAVVALKNGRNYIGTELNPEYIKIAEDRIADEIKPSLMDIME